jgi:sialic acid synthase SpsE
MINAIRNVEKALGKSEKEPTESEKKNMLVARKSIHLSHALSKGNVITEKDLSTKRPGDGISPMEMKKVLGKKLKKNLEAEHKLSWEDLE